MLQQPTQARRQGHVRGRTDISLELKAVRVKDSGACDSCSYTSARAVQMCDTTHAGMYLLHLTGQNASDSALVDVLVATAPNTALLIAVHHDIGSVYF